jgi:hypothetical protein
LAKREGKEPEVSRALEAARATLEGGAEGGAEGGGAEGGGAEGGGAEGGGWMCATGGLAGAQRQYLYFCASKACKLSTCGLGWWGSRGSGLVFVLLYQ